MTYMYFFSPPQWFTSRTIANCIANGRVFKSWSRQTQVVMQRDRVIPPNTPISFVNVTALRRCPKTDDVPCKSKCGTLALKNTNYNVDGH